jgi:hypothetical protein
MLKKSHHRHHHRKGQQKLGDMGFSLEWAAQASGAPSVMEQRCPQTHQYPLWVRDKADTAVSQCGPPEHTKTKQNKTVLPPNSFSFDSFTNYICRAKLSPSGSLLPASPAHLAHLAHVVRWGHHCFL